MHSLIHLLAHILSLSLTLTLSLCHKHVHTGTFKLADAHTYSRAQWHAHQGRIQDFRKGGVPLNIFNRRWKCLLGSETPKVRISHSAFNSVKTYHSNMHTYLYSIYQNSFTLFKIRYIIKNKVNSPAVTINFSFKAFGCLRLIFVPIYCIFLQYFKGVHNLLRYETCAMSAYRLLIQLREL